MLFNNCIVCDTLFLARKLYPKNRNDLNSLAERLGINPQLYRQNGQHSATGDTLLLAKVAYMLTQLNPIDFTFAERIQYQQFKLYQKTENFKKRFADFEELQEAYIDELATLELLTPSTATASHQQEDFKTRFKAKCNKAIYWYGMFNLVGTIIIILATIIFNK